MAGDVHRYLHGVIRTCQNVHAAMHEVYIDYPDRVRSRDLMFYAIRHFTRYRYSRPVWQSLMEVRMHPRSENTQRCFTFQLSVSPRARIFSHTDHLGNVVHHFDIPEQHKQSDIIMDALVDVDASEPVAGIAGDGSWAELREIVHREDHWDMLMPSDFARTSSELELLRKSLTWISRRTGSINSSRKRSTQICTRPSPT